MFLSLLLIVWVNHSFWCVGYFAWLAGVKKIVVASETVARPDNLAQASQSRLGETNRDSPKPYCMKGRPGDPLNFFERANISPTREGSRLSEIPRWFLDAFFEPSPRRRGLAWASTSRLSEILRLKRGLGRGRA